MDLPGGYVLRFSSRANGCYGCPSSEPADFPTECKGFFKWKLKHIKESYHGTLEGSNSKRSVSVASVSVQRDLCKVKLCGSQKAREPARPTRNNPDGQMERLRFVPMTLDKILSPAGAASLRQPLEIGAARGIQIYMYSYIHIYRYICTLLLQ